VVVDQQPWMHGLHRQRHLKAQVELSAAAALQLQALTVALGAFKPFTQARLERTLPGLVCRACARQQADLLRRHVKVARREKSPALPCLGLKPI
jgi:hypothetical protein